MNEPAGAGSTRGGPQRIERLGVRNYRALRDLSLTEMSPLTVLVGPNASGKSTVFDVFAFLSECFTDGLRRAWDRRGRFKELRSRGSEDPIAFEVKYRESPGSPVITYHLEIDEESRGPVVAKEWLQWRRGPSGKPFRFLEYARGRGEAVSGEMPDERDERRALPLASPDLLAVNTLGQFAEHPRVKALREFVADWYVSYLTADAARGQPEAGPQERLSRTGDNLPNVIQYLKERHEDRLDGILKVLSMRVPCLERVLADPMPDGRLLLQIKDAPFDRPILARFASDGTLKMLAYLVVLYDPEPPPFVGIEEPENHLHPRLLSGLAEECRAATSHSQLLVTTHSPFFVNALQPNEVLVLERDGDGFTRARRTSEMRGVEEHVSEGAHLGDLWMEGHFDAGDPFMTSGRTSPPRRA